MHVVAAVVRKADLVFAARRSSHKAAGGRWEHFTVMVSMAMLYAIHISDSEFGADNEEEDGDDD